MTIKEMHSWFDILQMKGNNIEFTSLEKDHIINRAQIKYVNEILQTKFLPSVKADEKDKLVYSPTESTISGEESISPLIVTDIDVPIGVSGHASFNWIATHMDDWLGINLSWYPSYTDANNQLQSSYTGSKVLMILGIDLWYRNFTDLSPRIPLRYMKNYEWRKSLSNIYKKPESHSPIYYIRNNAVQTAPRPKADNSEGSNRFFVTVIKEPRAVKIGHEGTGGESVDCELPNFTHDEIMAIALDDAGVATRDQALMQLNKANKDNLSETF